MIARSVCEQVFREAVAACDPAVRVRAALARQPLGDRDVYAIAIGKAALAMARGAGPVSRGLAIAPVLDGAPLPLGWTARDAGHPEPDERSLAAADAVIDVVESAGPGDIVLALISGGASALVERPAAGVTLEAQRAEIRALMHAGAPIAELNARRIELSAIKGGKLAARSRAAVVTLIVSDVVGDDPGVIGSGPTVREHARVEVVAPMAMFGEAIAASLHRHGIAARRLPGPLVEDVAVVAERLARERGAVVAWGEPTVRVPAGHGDGGRAQQLALLLAQQLRGTARSAFVAGSDGSDGPPPQGRPVPAGAYVDGATWQRIADPEAALARCDAGGALASVGALVVTGPTGINHADVVILG